MLSSSNPLNKRSQTRQHQQSLQDFMKHIKKMNLKSQRHLSPKPNLYMYTKPHHIHVHTHTSHTLEKSRSISNRKSTSKKSNKTGKSPSKLKKKVARMLDQDLQRNVIQGGIGKLQALRRGNPGQLIDLYSQKLKKVQKYLHKKSQLGHHLCQKFLQMLNNIVQNMITQLNHKMLDLQRSLQQRISTQLHQKYSNKYSHLQSHTQKLQAKLRELLQRQQCNNQLIYKFRTGWPEMGLPRTDIDFLFGKLCGIPDAGGNGYRKEEESEENVESEEEYYRQRSSPDNVSYQGSIKEQRNYQDQQGNNDVTDRKKVPKKYNQTIIAKSQQIEQSEEHRQKLEGQQLESVPLKFDVRKIRQDLKRQQKVFQRILRKPYQQPEAPERQQSDQDSARLQFRIRTKLPQIAQSKRVKTVTQGEESMKRYKQKIHYKHIHLEDRFAFQSSLEHRGVDQPYHEREQKQHHQGKSSQKKFEFP